MSLLDKHLIPVWMEHSMISEITLDRYIPEPVFVPGVHHILDLALTMIPIYPKHKPFTPVGVCSKFKLPILTQPHFHYPHIQVQGT